VIIISIKLFGWIWGILGLVVLWQVFNRTLLCFGLEHIGGMDSLMYCMDDDRGTNYIVAFMRIDRPDNVEAIR
jgi:hypothetical protein